MKNKRFYEFEEIEDISKYLERNKADFSRTLGKYSGSIKEVDGIDVKYMLQARSKHCFIAYQMLLKDVKFNLISEIKESKILYHNTNLQPIYADKIYATDINSAYANILYNDNVISEKTFNYICSLPKGERLACVGMLAARRNTYIYELGELETIERYESPYTKIFLYAVGKTFNIMMDLKNILQDDFLYSWVDCVYYLNKKRCHKIVNECLNDYKLKYKSIWLNEFEVQDLDFEYLVSYKKGNFFSKLIKHHIPKMRKNKKIILC